MQQGIIVYVHAKGCGREKKAGCRASDSGKPREEMTME
jgi:hypothetical protein